MWCTRANIMWFGVQNTAVRSWSMALMYHDMPITADRKPIKRLLSKHGEDATRQLIELHKADTLGQSAICRHRIAIFEEVSQMINEILQEESCFTLKDLAVNGHDTVSYTHLTLPTKA